MRNLLIGVMLMVGVAFAQNPAAIVESAAPFEGAVEGITDLVVISYLPGYGLHVSGRGINEYDLPTATEQLTSIVTGLSSLVRGLEPNDYVSVTVAFKWFGEGPDYVLARMIPNQPDTLEVFVNGALQ